MLGHSGLTVLVDNLSSTLDKLLSTECCRSALSAVTEPRRSGWSHPARPRPETRPSPPAPTSPPSPSSPRPVWSGLSGSQGGNVRLIVRWSDETVGSDSSYQSQEVSGHRQKARRTYSHIWRQTGQQPVWCVIMIIPWCVTSHVSRLNITRQE